MMKPLLRHYALLLVLLLAPPLPPLFSTTTTTTTKTSALFLCQGFAFQLPRIRLPWDTAPSPFPNDTANSSSAATAAARSKKAPIQRNDKIVVFGGTGGVGQLVTRKLLAREGKAYNVCVVARDATRARELLPTPTTSDNGNDNGKSDKKFGRSGSSTLDISELDLVGETKATDDQLRNAMVGSSAIVISVGTTAFPTQRWKGGNTPQAIDREAVSRIASLAADIPTMRRMV